MKMKKTKKRVYLVEDNLARLCALADMLKLLNKYSSSYEFEDGFAEKWDISRSTNLQWFASNKSDHQQIQWLKTERAKIFTNPATFLSAASDSSCVVVLDVDLEAALKEPKVRKELLAHIHAKLDADSNLKAKYAYVHHVLGATDKETPASFLIALATQKNAFVVDSSSADSGTGLYWQKLANLNTFIPTVYLPTRIIKADDAEKAILEKAVMPILGFLEDPLYWFLHPPGWDTDPNMTWFSDVHNSHNPAQGYYDEHLGSIRLRFPARDWDAGTGKSAKALCHSDGAEYTTAHNYTISCSCLAAVFDGKFELASPLDSTSRIRLPVCPGLPFLIAVKRFLEKVGGAKENATPLLRHDQKDGEGFSLCVRWSPTPTQQEDVRTRLNESLSKSTPQVIPSGQITRFFYAALVGKIEDPSHSYPDRYLRGLLDGAARCVAQPVITEEFVGVSWRNS
jgi:hypothetical protein